MRAIMAQAFTGSMPAISIPTTNTTGSQRLPGNAIFSKATNNDTSSSQSLEFHTAVPAQKPSNAIQRRNIVSLGIAGAVLSLNLREENAWAAARRPPPMPQEEKKDPNISGVQAKVLASKKRKEAMKLAMEKQRERGKKIEQ